jgi:hypothetical protein
MAIAKGAGKTALIVVAVLVLLHYVGPAAVKTHTGTV